MRGRSLILFCVVGLASPGCVPGAGDFESRPVEIPACAYEPVGVSSPGESACLALQTSFDRAPAVGETATVEVRLTSHVATSVLDLSLLLPPNLSFEPLPTGWSLSAPRTGVREYGPRASLRLSVQEGGSVEASVQVRAVSPGAAIVRARANAPPRAVVTATSSAAVTVSAVAGRSQLGLAQWSSLSPEAPVGLGPVAFKPGPPAAGEACVSGFAAFYQDGGGSLAPSRKVTVQVWDQDLNSAPDLLAEGETDDEGYFEVCFDNHDEENARTEGNDYINADGQDPFLVVIAKNPFWDVETEQEGTAYSYIVPGGVAPCACNNGAYSGEPLATDIDDAVLELGGPGTAPVQPPQESGLNLAFGIFDDVYRGWSWTKTDGTGGNWGAAGSGGGLVRVVWPSPGVEFIGYQEGNNEVFVGPLAATEHQTISRALGYALAVKGGLAPIGWQLLCPEGSLGLQETAPCAFLDGVSYWFALRVDGATVYNDTDLSDWGWYQAPPGSRGDAVPGAVAAALLDLGDADSEPPWDREKLDPSLVGAKPHAGALWKTLFESQAKSLHDFYSFYSEKVDDEDESTRALATLFGNTIDYDFRDPLDSGRPESRKWAVVPHNFRVDLPVVGGSNRWTVTGLLSFGSQHDLNVFEDNGLQTLAASSKSTAGDGLDFVATRVSPPLEGARLYPQVVANGQGGTYDIEHHSGLAFSGPGTFNVDFSGPGEPFVRAVTFEGLDPGKEVGIAAETPDVGGFLRMYGLPQFASHAPRANTTLGIKDISALGDARSAIRVTDGFVQSWAPGAVLTNPGGAQSLKVFVDQTPPVLDGVIGYIARTWGGSYARITLPAVVDPETGLRAVWVTVPFQAVNGGNGGNGGVWILLNGIGDGWIPYTDAEPWTDLCMTFTSPSGYVQVPCGGPTIDISNMIGLASSLMSSITIEVEVMNGAGLVSQPVQITIPVVNYGP